MGPRVVSVPMSYFNRSGYSERSVARQFDFRAEQKGYCNSTIYKKIMMSLVTLLIRAGRRGTPCKLTMLLEGIWNLWSTIRSPTWFNLDSAIFAVYKQYAILSIP